MNIITQIKDNVGDALAIVGGKIAGGAAFVGNGAVRLFTPANLHQNFQDVGIAFDQDMIKAINGVQQTGFNLICETPIARLANSNLSQINAPANASNARKALISLRNGLAVHHNNINQGSDVVARLAGKATYTVLNPILSGILGAGGCFKPGVLVGSAIALGIAAIVRAVTLVASLVIGHVLPYVITAAVAAAAVGGLALLAVKVSVFLSPVIIAGAIGVAVYVEARFRIAKLENQLTQLIKKQAADAKAASDKAAQMKKAGMIATATAATVAAAYYVVPAVANLASNALSSLVASGVANYAMAFIA